MLLVIGVAFAYLLFSGTEKQGTTKKGLNQSLQKENGTQETSGTNQSFVKKNVLASCQNAASQCKLKLTLDPSFNCTKMCTDACSVDGKDVLSGVKIGTEPTCPEGATACIYCMQGSPEKIK